MSNEPLDEVRKLMDAEIIRLDAQCSISPSTPQPITHERVSINAPLQLQLLKKLRNTYAPISELPNETLVEIFKMVEDPDNIAQICQHWRVLAVGTPSLWTRPPGDSDHSRTLRFLQRSKTALLDIHIRKETAFNTASAILENFGRIRSLDIIQTRTFMEDIGEVLPCDADHLEDLSIKQNWWDRDYESFEFSPDYYGITTKLRKLSLENVCFHWCDLGDLPALTHLSLLDVKVTHYVTGKEFTDTLREIPLLQNLSMSFGDIELTDYSATTPLEPIHLPELVVLDIRPESARDHIEYFLGHAMLPRLRTLNIDYGDDPVDYTPSVQALASAIQNADFHPLECLSIASEMIKMTALPNSDRDGPFIEIMLPVTHEDLDLDSDFDMATCILACLTPVGSKDPSSLVQLYIGTLDLTSDELQKLFGGLPLLEHIEFSSELADSFIEALSIPLDHQPDSSISFPKLKSIEWYGDGIQALPYPDPDLFGKLMDCLMQRCEYGVPIHDLVLKHCNLGADPVEARLLEQIVVNVSVSSGFW